MWDWFGTYCCLVVRELELVVLTPNVQRRSVRYGDSTLVDLAQSVHLLHVLPVAASEYARSGFQHLKIVEPQPSCVDVNADLLEHKLVSLCDDLSVLAGRVIEQAVSPPDEVDIRRVERNVGSQHDRLAEDVLDLGQLIELGLEGDVLDPLLALNMSVKLVVTMLMVLTAVGNASRKRSKVARASSFLCRLRCSSIRLSHASMSPRGSSAMRSSRMPMRS